MTAPTFDRRVPQELADALAPGGPMHPLVELVLSEDGIANALDIGLRARPGHAGARATLYLGLTQVLHVQRLGGGRFRLERQRSKAFEDAGLDPALFDPSWSEPRRLEELADAWPAVMAYVHAAVAAAPPRYRTSEGEVQARLGRGGPGFGTIDREVVINFPSRGVKDAALAEQGAGVRDACEQLKATHRWALRGKRFGDELDLLAVDDAGRVLVVEVKHGGDTAGVGWTPAQVSRYLKLCALWAKAAPNAAEILDGMLAQRAHIGLTTAPAFNVADPVTLVPVIAVGQPVRNPTVANERMQTVHRALAAHGVDLPGLEVWSVDGEEVSNAGLGGLEKT